MNDSRNRDDATPSWLASYAALWRSVPGSLAYLIGGFWLSMLALTVLSSVFFTGLGMVILVVGAPIMVGALLAARALAALDQSLLKLTGLPEVVQPTWPVDDPNASGLRNLLTPLRTGHYWSYLLHQMIVQPILSTITFSVAISWVATALGGLTFWMWAWFLPNKEDVVGGWISRGLGVTANGTLVEALVFLILGVVSGVTLPWVLRGLSRLHHGVASAMLGRWPSDDLVTQVRQESAAREAAIHAEDSAMRRLERDLHDGPQQRLVRLQMDLATVRRRLADDPVVADELVGEAEHQVTETLQELRALSRGIAPPVLSDRGLPSALASLAGRCTVQVDLDVALPDGQRLPEPVEETAYFVVAESLTNVAKHSAARSCRVGVRREQDPRGGRGEVVVVEVEDDGRGGAHPAKGHGLAGLVDRVAGVDGRLDVYSPDGGPTRVVAVLPCG